MTTDNGRRISAALISAERLIGLLFVLVWLGGCAGGNVYPRIYQSLVRGDCSDAAAMVESSREQYGTNSQLLYLLDSAMVGLQCHDFSRMQERLHAADDLAEKLWTQSISRNVAAIVTNDYALPYEGEDYERVMIHIVSAIGYLQTGQLDEALVEVRQLNLLLNAYVDQYHSDQLYKADAFARYLSGILREADGDDDGAYIDYAKAVEAYQSQADIYPFGVPRSLKADLLRMAVEVDRMSDARRLIPDERWSGGTPGSSGPAVDPGTGKVVVVVFSGEGPQKVQDTVVVPTPRGPITVAFPRVAVVGDECRPGEIQLSDGTGRIRGDLQLVSNIDQIAIKSLEQKKGRIIAKTIARAVAKQVVIEGIASTQNKRDRSAVATVLNVVNLLALEKADIRCWRTLPGHIFMARIYAKPGTYSGRLQGCRNQTFNLGDIPVTAGKVRFIFFDTRYGLAHQAG